MKTFKQFLEADSKEEQIKAQRERFHVDASAQTLQARATKFEAAYTDPSDAWWHIKNQIFHLVSELRSINLWASLFKEEIKTEDQLQEYFFDKLFPYLEKADMPSVKNDKFHQVFKDIQDDVMKGKL